MPQIQGVPEKLGYPPNQCNPFLAKLSPQEILKVLSNRTINFYIHFGWPLDNLSQVQARERLQNTDNYLEKRKFIVRPEANLSCCSNLGITKGNINFLMLNIRVMMRMVQKNNPLATLLK